MRTLAGCVFFFCVWYTLETLGSRWFFFCSILRQVVRLKRQGSVFRTMIENHLFSVIFTQKKCAKQIVFVWNIEFFVYGTTRIELLEAHRTENLLIFVCRNFNCGNKIHFMNKHLTETKFFVLRFFPLYVFLKESIRHNRHTHVSISKRDRNSI